MSNVQCRMMNEERRMSNVERRTKKEKEDGCLNTIINSIKFAPCIFHLSPFSNLSLS